MTDSEIIKALECCLKHPITGGCGQCPYPRHDIMCMDIMLGDTLGLLHRQQAEISRLVYEKEKAEMNLENLQQHIFEIREWEGEVKFLKKKIQTEAITEFAERLKRRYKDFCVDEGDMAFVVDSIVEEMRKD